MFARIFRPARNVMQSGHAGTREWVIEFETLEQAREVDPLMGWISSGDTSTQVRLHFDTRDEAIAFAQRKGVAFQVIEPREARRVVKTYADNFANRRRRPWTH
jgi:hypothetical protein